MFRFCGCPHIGPVLIDIEVAAHFLGQYLGAKCHDFGYRHPFYQPDGCMEIERVGDSKFPQNWDVLRLHM